MAKYVIDESTLKNLANAIRNVNGETKSYSPEEMVEKIKNLEVGGKPEIISFTIGGETYTAEEGMTWGQWIVSDYNPTKPDGCDGIGEAIDTFVIEHGYCKKMTMCGCEELTYAYIAPVKSVIKADVKLRILTVDDGGWDTPYCFEVGMTWAEYAASEYNPIVFCAHGHDDIEEYKLFVIGDEGVYPGYCPMCQGGEGALMLDGAYVLPDDEVIADAYYGWSNPDEDNSDEDNPDEGDDGLIEFTIGSFDGGADTFYAYEGMTWEEFADSEDNLVHCESCDDEFPAITISDGHVYCNCVVHDAAGGRYCIECYNGGFDQRLYYIDDDGSEIYVQATDFIGTGEYYCHE